MAGAPASRRTRRRHHRYQHGLPGQAGDHGQSGSALMRDLDHALTLIEATVAAVGAGHAEDAAWLGRSLASTRPSSRAAPKTPASSMITVHGRTRCQFYKGGADWAAVRAVKQRSRFRSSSTATSDPDDADAALACFGRRCRHDRPRRPGRPWLPGQSRAISRPGDHEAAPPLATQHALIVELYEEMLSHHGLASALKHARKHLGWALDARAPPAPELPSTHSRRWRTSVLTSETPAQVQSRLAPGL